MVWMRRALSDKTLPGATQHGRIVEQQAPSEAQGNRCHIVLPCQRSREHRGRSADVSVIPVTLANGSGLRLAVRALSPRCCGDRMRSREPPVPCSTTSPPNSSSPK